MEKKRIYVAEDDPVEVKLITAMLQPLDTCEITIFSDGLKFYQRVLADRPDLLIADILLPSLSGLAAVRLLKFHDDYSDIPIVVVSSIRDDSVAERVRQAGADVFLQKPVQQEELLESINRLTCHCIGACHCRISKQGAS